MILDFKAVHKIEKDLMAVPKNLKILCLAFIVYGLTWGTILPFFSLYLESIAPNYSQVGFLISLMSIVAAVVSVVMGDLIDKVGRKNILLISLANYIIIGPLYIVANTMNTVVLTRIYHGLASVGIWVPSRTYVRDISPPGKRAEYMGLFYTAVSFAYFAGPLIGAVMLLFIDIKSLFIIVPILSLIAMALIGKMPETIKPKRSIFQAIKDILIKEGIFRKEYDDYEKERSMGTMVTIVAFINKMAFAIILMILALYIDNIGGSLWNIGVIYAFFYLPFVFQFVFGDISETIGIDKMLVIGASMACIFMAALFFATDITIILILTFFAGMGIAMIAPVEAAYISMMAKNNNGEITGIYNGIADLAAFSGPIIAGFFADMYGLNSAFLFGSVAMVAVIIVGLKVESVRFSDSGITDIEMQDKKL